MHRAKSYAYLNASASKGKSKKQKPISADQRLDSDPLFNLDKHPQRVIVTCVKQTHRMHTNELVEQQVYEAYPSLDAFLVHAVRDAQWRTYYCILEREHRVCFYTDIELEPWHCASLLHPDVRLKAELEQLARSDARVQEAFARVDFDRVCTSIVFALRCAFETLFVRSLHAADVGVFRADKRTINDELLKYSCHVYVPSWVFVNVDELDALMKHVAPLLAALLEPLTLLALDTRVYHHHRNMRLPLHEKRPGMHNHLLPLPLGVRTERPDGEWMRYGMVNHCFAADAPTLPTLAHALATPPAFYKRLCTAAVRNDSVREAIEPPDLASAMEGVFARARAQHYSLAHCVRSVYYAVMLHRWSNAHAQQRPRYRPLGDQANTVPRVCDELAALGASLSLVADAAALLQPAAACQNNNWSAPAVFCAATLALRYELLRPVCVFDALRVAQLHGTFSAGALPSALRVLPLLTAADAQWRNSTLLPELPDDFDVSAAADFFEKLPSGFSFAV